MAGCSRKATHGMKRPVKCLRAGERILVLCGATDIERKHISFKVTAQKKVFAVHQAAVRDLCNFQ